MTKIDDFIACAMKYKGDKYSQPKRMMKGYSDCSSLVYKALRDSGNLDLSKTDRTVSTKFMKDGDPRFYEVPKEDLKRGDILWGGDYEKGKWSGHVAIYLGEGKTLEARYREGVCIYKYRGYFTKVYRVKSLLEGHKIPEPVVPAIKKAPVKATYNYLTVLGKKAKISPQVINGVSYVQLGAMMVPVRKFFETLGFTVKWTKEDGIRVE